MMQPGGGAGGGAGGLGGLGDILGKLGGPAAGGASHGRPAGGEAAASQGAGLEDLLRNLFPGAGGAPQGQPQAQPAAPEAGAGGGAGGGLGGSVTFSASSSAVPVVPRAASAICSANCKRAPSVAAAAASPTSSGRLLGQATQGARDGATRIGEATGARDALGKTTGGLSGDDILAKLKDLVQQNQVGAGAAMGGLGGLVLGTKAGRAMAGSAIKLGALALIGGLAYQAIQNYQQGKPALTAPMPSFRNRLRTAPVSSLEAVTNAAAALYIRAMIAAAAADGRIDAAEQAKIMGGLDQAGMGADGAPSSRPTIRPRAADLAAGCKTPEQAVQVFTAARFAISFDEQGEADFLNELAGALGLDAGLAEQHPRHRPQRQCRGLNVDCTTNEKARTHPGSRFFTFHCCRRLGFFACRAPPAVSSDLKNTSTRMPVSSGGALSSAACTSSTSTSFGRRGPRVAIRAHEREAHRGDHAGSRGPDRRTAATTRWPTRTFGASRSST